MTVDNPAADLEKNSAPAAEEPEGKHPKAAAFTTVLASSAPERALLNIANAKVLNSSTENDMQTETATTNYQSHIAVMIFLIGYFFFEVPSNILL
ncbi:Uu.00g036940.m01.CDS01 [Anthostomella pinea]|uniref:Uu.00g036940.m01.CDS01 n=1 Tax=Anthostomella pinea TaxID=933095 RepID=A0AAI8V9J3_9PEZI|nr:Uu.00g036940.m01.CDS01 [Anthostomella pinea]